MLMMLLLLLLLTLLSHLHLLHLPVLLRLPLLLLLLSLSGRGVLRVAQVFLHACHLRFKQLHLAGVGSLLLHCAHHAPPQLCRLQRHRLARGVHRVRHAP